MKFRMILTLLMSTACLAHGECRFDGCLYVSADELVESEDGDLFLHVDDAFYEIDGLYTNRGLYVLTGHDLGEFPEEYIIKCPCKDCGRYQTNTLLKKNRNSCSWCKRNVYRCQSR